MAAAKLNLKIEQGATFSRVVTWNAGVLPTPVNLTGCTARMQVRERFDSPDKMLELSTEAGGIALGGAAGTIAITATASQTAAMRKRSGVYDLEVQFADGAVRRLLQGTVAISPEVTHE